MTYYPSYHFTSDKTVLAFWTGGTCDFCERVEVTDTFTDIVTGDITLNVRITFSPGKFKDVRVPRTALMGNILTVLCSKGLSVSNVNQYAVTLSEILMDTEITAVKHFCHNRLGFHRDKSGKLCFLSAKSIGRKEKSTRLEYERYASKGTFEQWQAGVKPYIDARPELQLAILIGLSAPVATLLSMHGELYYTLIYALIGKSSTGKSTSLRLMCSLWCRPSTANGGIDLLTDTDNYMLAMLAQKNGYPQFYDDTSTMPEKDFTQLIYTIASSKERGRCNSDGTPRCKRTWSGTVVFTGEHSMLACNEKFTGRIARLIEFNVPWTQDAKSAEELSKVCNKYYGTAHKVFLKHLCCKHQHKLLKKRFESAVELLSDKLGITDGIQRRQVQMLGVLLVTLAYAREVFDFEFNAEAIEALIVDTFKANLTPESEADRLYNFLLQKVIADRSYFPRKGNREPLLTSAWGEEGEFKNIGCFWISSTKFTEFLKDAGYQDVNYAAKILHEAKYLAKFGDRYKKNHTVCGINTNCYALFKNAFMPVAKKKSKPKSNLDPGKSQLSTLVSDKEIDVTEV